MTAIEKRPKSKHLVMALILLALLAAGITLELIWKVPGDGVYWGPESREFWNWVWVLRVPRLILALAVGVALAVAGATLQTLFSNPLCEPYTLGISSGAALGSVVAMTLGFLLQTGGVGVGAFVGSLSVIFFLHQLSRRLRFGPQSILLLGVMIGFFGSSLVALWMALSDPNGIQNLLFWLMGSLSRAQLGSALLVAVVVSGGVTYLWSHSAVLDAFLLGDEFVQGSGESARDARLKLLVVTSIVVGMAVATAGIIGFVGLLVPHFFRATLGSLHRRLIPFCALGGALLMVWADLAAVHVWVPYELPVGVITALMGAPIFIFLMLQKATQKQDVS